MQESIQLSVGYVRLIIMLDIGEHDFINAFLFRSLRFLEIDIGQAYLIAVEFLYDLVRHLIDFFHFAELLLPRLDPLLNLRFLFQLLFLFRFFQFLELSDRLLHGVFEG